MSRLPTLAELELANRRRILLERLAAFDGVAVHAAASLGVSVRTFERMAEACGLQRRSPCSREWLQPADSHTTTLVS